MINAEDATLDYAYLTTTGRTSGQPREIEIWFAPSERGAFLLSGGRDRSHWVKNLVANPAVTLRIGDRTYRGTARIIDRTPEGDRARDLLFEKYSTRSSDDLRGWRDSSLPVAIDFEG